VQLKNSQNQGSWANRKQAAKVTDSVTIKIASKHCYQGYNAQNGYRKAQNGVYPFLLYN